MNKKSIAVALLILMISMVFISCGKKRSWEKDDTTAAPSETTSIEYTTDESGEKFVTNINGELIPVTTGKDGSVEFYEDLITKTSEQAAETEQISDERCRKGEAETVPRTEKYGAENVYDMLYRRTLTAEYRERE